MTPQTTDRLRDAVEQRSATGKTSAMPASRRKTVQDLINEQRTEIARALPKHMDADRLARVVLTVLKTNPKLLEASPQSLLAALMLSAQLGLEPGPLGHCYFVPFRNKGQTEVQWILGYKGIIDLARRSGQLLSIESREVCRNDHFEFEYGLDDKLIHRPCIDRERGPVIAFYGIARFKDGGWYIHVLSKADVDGHRARSRSPESGPWATDYIPMGRKTVIRAMAPFLPLNVESARAFAADERVHRDTVPDLDAMGPILDVTPTEQSSLLEHGAPDREEAATVTNHDHQIRSEAAGHGDRS